MENELLDIIHYKPSPLIKGNDPRQSTDNKSTLGWNVCYIVCGLIIKDDKVLMVQESKLSCRGKWYLPAGRVDPNESLEDAVKREVKEEAGVDFEPDSLILVEAQGHSWLRFTFTGRITGGQLKTLEQADKESLQAGWLPVDHEEMRKEFRLRALDCISVIRHANNWYSEGKGERYTHLTVPSAHTNNWLRIVLINENRQSVLVRNTSECSSVLPCGVFNGNLYSCLSDILKVSGYTGQYTINGILLVEHLVSGGDGVGLTLLLTGEDNDIKDDAGHWESISGNPVITEHFKRAITHKYMTIRSSLL